MHSVDADIINLSSDRDISLNRVNKFSIANDGTADVLIGFKDTFRTLKQGQATVFESGANAWFGDKVILKVRFKKAASTDSSMCSVALCTVLKPSGIFADPLK
jgi:hypothetical protein